MALTNTVGTTTSANATLTVNERSWSAPAGALASGARQIASVVDSNGHTHVVAVTGNNLAAGVEARIQLRSNDSTQANAFVTPDQSALQASTALVTGRPAPTLTVAANNNGFVLALWHINGAAWARLFQPPTTNLPQGHWQSAVRISAALADSGVDPAVVAVGEDFEVVWRERPGTSGVHDVKATHYDRVNNIWSPAIVIEARATETEAPQIVVDAAGNVPAAWRHIGEGVWANRHAASAAWGSTLTQIDSSDTPLETLRANAAGRAVVVSSNRLGSGLALQLDLAASNLIVSGSGRVIDACGSAPAGAHRRWRQPTEPRARTALPYAARRLAADCNRGRWQQLSRPREHGRTRQRHAGVRRHGGPGAAGGEPALTAAPWGGPVRAGRAIRSAARSQSTIPPAPRSCPHPTSP